MNKNEMKEYYKKNKRKILPSILISIIIIMWAFSIVQQKYESELVMGKALQKSCSIEYGDSRCYKGKLYIPFYNPNQRNIDFVKLSIPVSTGTNIYNVNESLGPKKSSVITTIDCKKDVKINNFKVMWCCGDDCFEVKMNKPSKDVIVKIES